MAESQWRNEEHWCITQTNVTSISYKWIIQNFSFHVTEVEHVLTSSSFSSPNMGSTKWYIKMYPMGNTEVFKNFVSIFLNPVLDHTSEVSATFSISIINNKNEKVNTRRQTPPIKFVLLSLGRGWTQFIKTSDLLEEENGLLVNDTLTILCEVKFMTEYVNIAGDSSTIDVPESRLESDLETLLSNELFSDVTLVVSGKKFNVHKNILAARSPVFAAMFSIDMKEKKDDVAQLFDMDPETLQVLLYFIYTGKAPKLKSVEDTCKLLTAADKYATDRLKLICENSLCSALTVENVSELLVLADLHNAEQLKARTMNFIQNHITAVQGTKGWISLFRKLPNEEFLPPADKKKKDEN